MSGRDDTMEFNTGDFASREDDVTSSPPPAAAGASARPKDDDLRFVYALSDAGLMKDVSYAELGKLMEGITEAAGPERIVSIFGVYYGGAVGEPRRATDRVLLHQVRDALGATAIVSCLAGLLPDVGKVALERIGGGDGPLVMRAGEHVSAVVDDEDDEGDDESTVSVRSLVGAFNVLLDRKEVRERFVPFGGDDNREAYAAISVTHAMPLCREGFLDGLDVEQLMEFAGW